MTNEIVQALNYLNKIQSEAKLTEQERAVATAALQQVANQLAADEKTIAAHKRPEPDTAAKLPTDGRTALLGQKKV
jgi:hypothetical protein